MCYITAAGAGAATVTPQSGTIDGASSLTLKSGMGCVVFWDGANWETDLVRTQLQTNGTKNSTQRLLNIAAGTGVTIVESGGTVTVNANAAGAGTAPFNNMLVPSGGAVPPVLSALTWGNQGTATATTNGGGALTLTNTGSGSDDISMLYKSAPSTPYTLTIGFIPGVCRGLSTSGIAFRESSSGKLIIFGFGQSSSPPSLFLQKFTNYTTFSAAYFSTLAVWPTWIGWISAEDDGTNLTWSVSIDGQTFFQVYQSPRGNFFSTAPNQVGIFIDANTSAMPTSALFVHWSGV
jgi:hypothetical protein